MLRPTALKLLLAVSFMLTSYTIFIYTSSALFPCTLRDAKTTHAASCFLDSARELGSSGYLSAELTPAGWMLAVLLVGVLPTLGAFLLGSLADERT